MKRLIILFIGLIGVRNMHAQIIYKVSFPQPETHQVQVEIELDNPSGNYTDFIMPVWTPGSYKVREYSRNVISFKAAEGENPLEVSKLNKFTWRVNFKKGIKKIKATYTVYAFEMGVRTSMVDQFGGFLHGVSIFMYVDGFIKNPCIISYTLPPSWKQITVALPEISKNTFLATNYDLLADSPFALGNHPIISFKAAGVNHRVAMLGDGNYEAEKIITDFTKIIEKEVSIFGEHPCNDYVFFIQNVESGGGGLEHLNSQTSVIQRWAYSNELKYKNFLALIAHEYFHLWNVKRIRPIELGPFDYTKENYTNMLWIAEGVTSYYDDLFIKRCGIYKEEEYLNIIATAINRNENLVGAKIQTLAESGFDAWIKFYLPDENSDNSSISYYQKGMLVSLILDLEIINRTNGVKKLDDVMLKLYQDYYINKNRGFTELEFAQTFEIVTGTSFEKLIKTLVYTTDPIEINQYLDYVGLELVNQDSKKFPLGISIKLENGKTLVKYVEVNKVASKAGMSVNDEIISLGGYRVNGDLDEFTSRYKDGEIIEAIISRAGKILTLRLVLEKDSHVNYKIAKVAKFNENQKKLFDYWMK